MKKFRLQPRSKDYTVEQFISHVRATTRSMVLDLPATAIDDVALPSADNVRVGRLPMRPWLIRMMKVATPICLIVAVVILINYDAMSSRMIQFWLALVIAFVVLIGRSMHNLQNEVRAWFITDSVVAVYSDAIGAQPPTVVDRADVDAIVEIKTFDRRNRPEPMATFHVRVGDQLHELAELGTINIDRDADFLVVEER